LPPKSKKGASKRFQVLDEGGTKVLLMDYSLASREEVWDLTKQFEEWVVKQEPNSVNVLFDVYKPYYEPAHINHWKKTLGRNDVYIRKSAFIRASPLFHALLPSLRAFAALMGVPMKKNRGIFFKTKEEAVDWLKQP
jgi:hypothetical protein